MTFLHPDTLLALSLFASIIAILLVIRLEWRLRKLFRGQRGADLEDTLLLLGKGIDHFHRFEKEVGETISHIEQRVKKSFRGLSIKRYNPWKGMGLGGDHSSSTALLNEHGDGIVITSLYSRDRVSMFVKPIESFAPTAHELTPEEKEAVNDARSSLSHTQ